MLVKYWYMLPRKALESVLKNIRNMDMSYLL